MYDKWVYDMMPKLQKHYSIINLYKWLKGCEYGGFTKGLKPCKDDFSDFVTQSNFDLEKTRKGVCWEQSNYAFEIFHSEFRFPYTYSPLKSGEIAQYYIESEDGTSHTWMAWKGKIKVFVMETAWYQHRGIHRFNSENEMLLCYEKWFNKSKDIIVPVYIFSGLIPRLNCVKFMEAVKFIKIVDKDNIYEYGR